MLNEKGSTEVEVVAVLSISSIGLCTIASWFTHVVVCLKAGSWGFLLAGAIMFPIGIIHGFGIWIGVW